MSKPIVQKVLDNLLKQTRSLQKIEQRVAKLEKTAAKNPAKANERPDDHDMDR